MSYRTRDQRIADETADSYIACSYCKKMTLTETLSQYGARCFPCYEAYLAEVPGKEHFTLAEKKQLLARMRSVLSTPADPKAWARALKAREEGGERLSILQRTMWRAAIGARESA